MTAGPVLRRWLKFNAAGAIGIVVQLAALTFFHSVAGLGYLPATAIAVECAILHNFIWHERWTWRDRAGSDTALARLLRFHLSTGLVSLVCNLAGMRLLADVYGMPYPAANLITIAAGAPVNFLAADLFVFRRTACGFRTECGIMPHALVHTCRASRNQETL
jgi:putative flippase GtrA